MKDSFAPIPLEALLAHAGWARRLARSLISDADEADDVLQETWIIGAKRPPDDRGAPHPWLATVIRRVAGRHAREKRARNLREEGAAALEEPQSAETLSLRLEAQRQLASCVQQLDGTFRTTILLHFYENLSCAEISRLQGVPAGTVRWRLKRGLELLRAAMNEKETPEKGGCKALLLPLLPTNESVRPRPAVQRPVAWVWPVLAAGLGAVVLMSRFGNPISEVQPSMTSALSSPASMTGGASPELKHATAIAKCDGIESLKAEVARAEAEAVKQMSPDMLFEYPPGPTKSLKRNWARWWPRS